MGELMLTVQAEPGTLTYIVWGVLHQAKDLQLDFYNVTPEEIFWQVQPLENFVLILI
jgi:hypothetical protein